jgi:hypothetical protein
MYERIQNEHREIVRKIFAVKSDNRKEELLTMMLHLRKFPKIFGFFRLDFVNSTLVRIVNLLFFDTKFINFFYLDIQQNASIFGDFLSI